MPLSEEQALDLLSSTKDGLSNAKQKPEYTPKWPSRNEKLAILMAIKDDEDVVLLRTGKFIIRRTKLTKHDDPNDKAYSIKPAGGFVPCGWFTLKDLERDLA